MSEDFPALSIGLAVRNGRNVIERCIKSILSQDFTDLELVVCDNASDDGTMRMLDDYARADPRIRLSANQVNIGSHENMKRVLEASRGTFFRWISADDWLEPRCLSKCVRALESQPDAIGVTTWFTIHTPDGSTRYEEYRGEFPTSPDPARRFQRMLWFFHAGDAKYDPIYGIYRRNCLMRSHALRRRSGPTGCSAPNWRSWARSSMWTSGLQTAHAPTHVASIEPRSGVASTPSAQSNCGRPRVACIASCTLSRFQRTFRRRSCAVADGLFGASGSKRGSARLAYESRTRGIECSDAERSQSLLAIHVRSDCSTRRSHASRQKG